MEYKATKIKGAVGLHCNEDPAIQMVRAEEMGRRCMIKDAFRFAEELGIEFYLKHPSTVNTRLRKCQVERLEEEIRKQQSRYCSIHKVSSITSARQFAKEKKYPKLDCVTDARFNDPGIPQLL